MRSPESGGLPGRHGGDAAEVAMAETIVPMMILFSGVLRTIVLE